MAEPRRYGWLRWVVAILVALVLLYLIGFVIFGCGTDTGSSPFEEGVRSPGVHFAG
jgi:hypothetical protein